MLGPMRLSVDKVVVPGGELVAAEGERVVILSMTTREARGCGPDRRVHSSAAWRFSWSAR